MSLTGLDFDQGKFQDVQWLMRETEALYTRIVERHGPTKALLPLTASELVKLRGWGPAMPLIADNLEPVLDELKVFFVPKVMKPGPCLVFPQRDIQGTYTRARLKPMYDLNLRGKNAKYAALGVKGLWQGPTWIGNTIQNTGRLLQYRSVAIVEGTIDLVAARLVCPQYPILSTGNTTMGPKHYRYLQMMGVNRIMFMWDNEQEKVKGGGTNAAKAALAVAKRRGFLAEMFTCPAKDASDCLQSYETAEMLQRAFLSAFR